MKQEPTHKPVAHKYKAGVILVGDVVGPDGSKRLHVLAPWTEGSFSTDGKKAYMLAKGTVDKNEDRWQAAIREVGEETGIYLDRISRDERPKSEQRFIFNPESKKHQKWKAAGRDCFYENVEIERIWKKPVISNVVPSNRGNPSQHDIYLVKVKGIEHLAPYLKHKENNVEGDSVKRKAFDISIAKAAQKEIPTFIDMVHTLRTGWWKWGSDTTWHGKLFDSDFASHERNYLMAKYGTLTTENNREMFRIDPVIAGQIMSGALTISSLQEFDDFYHNYAVTHDIQDAVKGHVAIIRKHMEAAGLANDCTSLKVDTKNSPLRYYQEGADIIPYDTWIDRAITFADQPENRVYREMQFNRHVNDRKPGRAYDGTGQSIGGVMLEIGKMLDMAEGNPVAKAGKAPVAGSVVFDTAQSIFNELGRVVYSAPLQEPAVNRLHAQVANDRKSRGIA